MDKGIWTVEDVSIQLTDAVENHYVVRGEAKRQYVVEGKVEQEQIDAFLALFEKCVYSGKYLMFNKVEKHIEAKLSNLLYEMNGEDMSFWAVLNLKAYEHHLPAKADSHVLQNLVSELATQKAVVQRLLNVLESQELIDAETLAMIRKSNHPDIDRNETELYTEVFGLEQYLKDIKMSVADFRKLNRVTK